MMHLSADPHDPHSMHAEQTPLKDAESCPSSVPSGDVVDFLKAQQAIGASLGEALGVGASVWGIEAMRRHWEDLLKQGPGAAVVMAALDGVAQVDPMVATAWLNEAIAQLNEAIVQGGLEPWHAFGYPGKGYHFERHPWVRSISVPLFHTDLGLEGCKALENLPTGLRVEGDLALTQCRALVDLPVGLYVGGDLNIEQCVSLRSLPRGMHVRGHLEMEGCTSWDGRIPEDARIVGLISTDKHRFGIGLQEWRKKHPQGERSTVWKKG